MNEYIFDIYILYSIMLEHEEEEDEFKTYYNLVEIAPLNMHDSSTLEKIKNVICEISSWWKDFSAWGKISMHFFAQK